MKRIFCVLGLIMSLNAAEIVAERGGVSVEFVLNGSSASREFAAQLPLMLNFSDYASKEKIAHLSTPLNAHGDASYKPAVGDIFYFTPWGNVGIFYKKQPPNSGLVPLGRVKNAADVAKIHSFDGAVKIYQKGIK